MTLGSTRPHITLRRRMLGIAASFVVSGVCLAAVSASAPKSRTLGFVITVRNIAMNESRFADECPEGFNVGYDEIWWRGLSKPDRARLTDNGLKSRLERYFVAIHRGPKGEDVCMHPEVVQDPPLLLAEGKESYGMNLDGDTTGEGGANFCKHDNFTGLDGTPGVDNQLFRLLGCVYGFRSYGQYEANENENRKSNGKGMTLIEVSNVDDTRNDDDVLVTFYRSIDQYTLDAAGKFVPFASYRVDTADGKPRYASSLKGRIRNGVLTTDAGDVNLPFYGNYTYMNQLLRDMRLRMEIAPDLTTSKGMQAGYYDVEQLMFYVGGLGPIASSSISNCPSIAVAARQVADGYRDPKTGDCTAISAAFNFSAVAAFIVHPKAGSTATTSAGLMDRISGFFREWF